MASQVEELLRYVDDARQARHGECARLLLRMTPHLQEALPVERRLDPYLKRRFNVFKYLREDELGLSRVIADLLDPHAGHGQGTRFLKAMLEAFPETRGEFGRLRVTAANSIRVAKERLTTTGRRIDITVDIRSATGRFCLAFENKPYASDQDRQVKAYLEYLREQYGKHFLLVYLPPVPREPGEASLPQAEHERWHGHFKVMPYAGGDPSLEGWFATCRKLCDDDRVSWFLRDAELFCQQRFGESTMTTNPDTRFVHKFLSDNPSHLRAALAIHDAWHLVRAGVCERFLEHLRDTVEARLETVLPDIGDDFHVKCLYVDETDKKYANFLWIYRDAWVQYDDPPPNEDGHSAIVLQSGRGRPSGWYWGVRSPKPLSQMTETEKERREELATALGRHGLSLRDDRDWWPQWEWLRRFKDWYQLVPELSEECEKGGGRITDYYADRLLDIARCAIPAIEEVEGSTSNPRG